MTEFIDGHRWPKRATSPEPSVAPDAPAAPDPDQREQPGARDDDLPPFSVRADYSTCMVALLFDPDHVPLLMRHPLFASSSRLLQGAQIDCEQWIDEQVRDERDRQLRQVGR